MSDLASLNILPATHYPKATDYIPEMVEMILELAEKGLAYENEDGWWYSGERERFSNVVPPETFFRKNVSNTHGKQSPQILPTALV